MVCGIRFFADEKGDRSLEGFAIAYAGQVTADYERFPQGRQRWKD